jgi:predicted O-methyltransferase YrrM
VEVTVQVDDSAKLCGPSTIDQLLAAASAIGFRFSSEPQVGSLLRTLAASKPTGQLLELGTGVGIGAACLLAGMDPRSTLITVENDKTLMEIAKRSLANDPRVTFYPGDAAQLIAELSRDRFDLIFADTWAGKYTHLDETLQLLKTGGFYVIDDMLPQPSWPPDHLPKVEWLIAELESRRDLALTKINWGSGIILAARIGTD